MGRDAAQFLRLWFVCPVWQGCLYPRQISGRRAACPPARRPRRELRSARRLEARPGPAGLAAASNRSGCLCISWPGHATSHGHRSLAVHALRCPPHRRCLRLLLGNFACNSLTSAVRGSMKCPEFQRLHADTCSACGGIACECVLIRTCHGPRASEISRVKPVSPLLAQAEPQMKPPSPLRERNGRFWCSFRAQW